jgi:hypothetical protein
MTKRNRQNDYGEQKHKKERKPRAKLDVSYPRRSRMKTEPDTKQFSEFEIQAEAYYRLKQVYPIVRGELYHKDPEGYRDAQFDIVVKDENGLFIAVIEVKRRLKGKLEHQMKQIKHYERLAKCPVILVRGMEQAKNVVEMVENRVNEEPDFT